MHSHRTRFSFPSTSIMTSPIAESLQKSGVLTFRRISNWLSPEASGRLAWARTFHSARPPILKRNLNVGDIIATKDRFPYLKLGRFWILSHSSAG